MLRRQMHHKGLALPCPLSRLLHWNVPPTPPGGKVVLGVPSQLVLWRALAVREGLVGRMGVVVRVGIVVIPRILGSALDPTVRAGLLLILPRLLLFGYGLDVEGTESADWVATALATASFAAALAFSCSSSWAGRRRPLFCLLPTLQMSVGLLLLLGAASTAIWRSSDGILLLPAAALLLAAARALGHGCWAWFYVVWAGSSSLGRE